MATTLIGDHQAFGGTPLAMLAAQCSKITNRSPPPLAEATVGKSFMPWKKTPGMPTSGSLHHPHHHHHITPQRMSGLNPATLQMTNNLPYPRTAMVPANSHPAYTNDLLYASSGTGHHPTPQTSDLSQSALLQRMHSENTISGSGFGSMYSRVPPMSSAYDHSWPFHSIPSPHPGAPHAIKHEMTHSVSSGGSTHWWEVHPAANMHTTGCSWLSDSPSLHGQIAASYPSPDYHISHPLPSNPSLLPSQQHLLQDTYKSMLQPSQPELSLSTSPVSSFLSRPALPGLHSPRNSRRYTGRATCDCPNCHEIDRLGPAGEHLRKRNIHSCHIPGCGKVYNKTSHLKAHLRWHTGSLDRMSCRDICALTRVRRDSPAKSATKGSCGVTTSANTSKRTPRTTKRRVTTASTRTTSGSWTPENTWTSPAFLWNSPETTWTTSEITWIPPEVSKTTPDTNTLVTSAHLVSLLTSTELSTPPRPTPDP